MSVCEIGWQVVQANLEGTSTRCVLGPLPQSHCNIHVFQVQHDALGSLTWHCKRRLDNESEQLAAVWKPCQRTFRAWSRCAWSCWGPSSIPTVCRPSIGCPAYVVSMRRELQSRGVIGTCTDMGVPMRSRRMPRDPKRARTKDLKKHRMPSTLLVLDSLLLVLTKHQTTAAAILRLAKPYAAVLPRCFAISTRLRPAIRQLAHVA
jgi:hypothetical protein